MNSPKSSLSKHGRVATGLGALVAVTAVLGVAGTPAPAADADAGTVAYPLDPLTPAEIRAAAQLLQKQPGLSKRIVFPTLVLNEPPKDAVLAYKPDRALPREAFAVVYDRDSNKTYEAVIDLSARTMKSLTLKEGVHPFLMVRDFKIADDIVRADARVKEALARRGINSFDGVKPNVWGPGSHPVPDQPEEARFARVLFYYNEEDTDSFGRPIEGLVATVNLNTGKVVEIIDTGVVPVPNKPCDFFDPAQIGPLRQAPRPLELVQRQGPSFEIRGQEVRWQKWRFRYANHQREGLVLYQVGYEDQGRVRPILYRASVSELFVPYAEPDESWVWRDSFDQGDYGLGVLSDTLQRGKHVPENAVLLDSVFAGEVGDSRTIPASVAVYERDGGILWEHKSEYPLEKVQCRRARELVVFALVNVGNYDYGLNWIFTQDGQIKVEIELTGILRAKAVAPRTCQRCAQLQGGTEGTVEPEGADRYGTLVAENLIAPNHQHFVNFRLDFDVDGAANTVSEMNVRAAPTDPARPGRVSHNAFVMEETVLGSEQEGGRDVDPRSHRRWKVFNPSVKTALGHYPGYILEPGETALPFVTKDDPARRQAGFLDHQVWVTRYKPNENHAAGDYPNQGKGGDGLPRYVSDNEKIVGQDVVLWYTLGITHVARPEEWPVMPIARGGFRLVPDGFFTRNPGLDVPD